MARSGRVLRRKRPPINYSSDTSSSEEERVPKRKKTKHVGRPRQVKRRPDPVPRREKVTAAAVITTAPPWPPELEFSILVDIFQYAAYPLENDLFEVTPSVSWLINLATTCKNFHEPALTALYYAPPISRPSRARGLLARLKAPPENSSINYRAKVRYLNVLAGTVSLKYMGHDPLKLEEFVPLTPGLRGLDIRLNSDEPRRKRLEATYFEQDTRISHIYQQELFNSLDKHSIRLRTWRWNLKFNKTDPFPWEDLSTIHGRPCFEKLQTLEISKLHAVDQFTKDRSLASIIQSISPLKQLKEIIFTMCEIHSYEDTLKHLPPNLESINFRDCSGLTSSELSSFLSTHGCDLRKLTLDYNASLDFAFLKTLGKDCPKLETLHVDLTIYGALSTGGAKTHFRTLLPENTKPYWPQTLQDAQFHALRKWTIPQAEPFFQSFIDRASRLPHLRTLVIKASLDAGSWRDRIPFRNKWSELIETTFKRQSPAPIRYGPSSSSTPMVMVPLSSHVDKSSQSGELNMPVYPRLYPRSSERLRPKQATGAGASAGPIELRLRLPVFDEPPTPATSRSASKNTTVPFIHGGCDKVEVRMDNMRPAEYQFTEADFLDKEDSSGDEWQSGDTGEGEGDEPYAW